MVMLVSDEAPEATCLSICMWLLPAPRSASIPAACVSLARRRRSLELAFHGWPGAGPAATSYTMTLQPGRWPGKFPPDGAPCRPGPSPGGWSSGHLRPGSHPRRFIRPAVWMFATAWAPCLCASEARPSDRGIQWLGIRPRHLRSSPSSGGRPLQRAGFSGLRQPSIPAPAPPRL